MKYKDYYWEKTFEIKGFFSEKPEEILGENNVSGILHYSINKIELELLGEFEGSENSFITFGKKLDRIYGFSSDGNLLILNVLGYPSVRSSHPGFPITKYRVKEFFIYNIYFQFLKDFNGQPKDFKNLVENLESKSISKYFFGFDHIEKWINKSLVKSNLEGRDIILQSSIDEYKPTNSTIHSLSMNFEDSASVQTSIATTSFTSIYLIKVTSTNPKSMHFDDFYQASLKYLELIELLTNCPLSFTTVEFVVEENTFESKKIPIIRGKFFTQHVRKSRKWHSDNSQSVSLSKLDSDFEAVLNNWFEKSEDLEFIVKRYTNNLHGDSYMEDVLLGAIRNLEVFSRNFRSINSTENLDEAKSKARYQVLDFINKTLPQDLQKYFRNQLRLRKKEPTLHQRLEDLFSSIDTDIKFTLFKDYQIDDLIEALTQTRNYLTHGNKKEKFSQLIDGYSEMFDIIDLLQEVLRYYIFKELCLDYSYS